MSRKLDKDQLDKFHDYDIYMPSRTVFVGSVTAGDDGEESGTDFAMAERLIKNLHVLETISSEPITIVLNNLGGDFYHGMALYDRIAASPCHITIKVYGQAMSMGAAMFQAADKRVMSKNAVLMIHYGYAGVDSTAKNFQRWAKEYERTDAVMESILFEKIQQKNPNFKLKDLKKMLSLDTFFTAEQAVKMGLCDAIDGEPDGD